MHDIAMRRTSPRSAAAGSCPAPSAQRAHARPRSRGLLRFILNIPPLLYHAGLARRLGSRVLLLTTVGRRTRRRRTVGLNYASVGETVYVISGFGETDWLRNLAATPEVEVTIGSRSWTGVARRVQDPAEAALARGLLRERGMHQGPPRPLRGLFARLGLDHEAELEVLDRSDLDLPVVAIRQVGNA